MAVVFLSNFLEIAFDLAFFDGLRLSMVDVQAGKRDNRPPHTISSDLQLPIKQLCVRLSVGDMTLSGRYESERSAMDDDSSRMPKW